MKPEKPIMGWNTRNTFGENINEELIIQIADKMVELDYKGRFLWILNYMQNLKTEKFRN